MKLDTKALEEAANAYATIDPKGSPNLSRVWMDEATVEIVLLRSTLSHEREAREKAEKELSMWREVKHSSLWKIRSLTAEASLAEAKRLLKPFADAKGHFDSHVKDDDAVEIALRHIRARHVRDAARFLSQEPNHER